MAGEVVVALVGRPLDDPAIDALWPVVRDGGMVDDVIAAADALGVTEVAALDRGPTRRLVVRGTVLTEALSPGDDPDLATAGLLLRLTPADPIEETPPAGLALDRGLLAAAAVEVDAWSDGAAEAGAAPVPTASGADDVDGEVDGDTLLVASPLPAPPSEEVEHAAIDDEVDGDTVLVASPLPAPPVHDVGLDAEEAPAAAVADNDKNDDHDDAVAGDTILVARPLPTPPAEPVVEEEPIELVDAYGPSTSPDAVNAARPKKPGGIRSLVGRDDDSAIPAPPSPPPTVHVDSKAPPAPPPPASPAWFAQPAPRPAPAPIAPPPASPAPPPLEPQFDPDSLRLPDARPAGLAAVISDVPRPAEPSFPLGGPGVANGAPAVPVGADHDGMTVSAAEVRALTGTSTDQSPGPVTPLPAGPGHQAVQCPAGHLNPPHADRCRVCGSAVPIQAPFLVPSVDLGVFRFSTGLVKPLVRSMVIGRAPKLGGSFTGPVPELITVPSPEQDISRTHVEVRLEGWQVLVLDKGSTNGTTVTIPGHGTQRLRPDVPFPLPVGAVLSLADEVSIAFEVTR